MAAKGYIGIESIQTGYIDFEIIKYGTDPGFNFKIEQKGKNLYKFDITSKRGGVIPYKVAEDIVTSSSYYNPESKMIEVSGFKAPVDAVIASVPILGGNKLIGRPDPPKNATIGTGDNKRSVTRRALMLDPDLAESYAQTYKDQQEALVRQYFGFTGSTGGFVSTNTWATGTVNPLSTSGLNPGTKAIGNVSPGQLDKFLNRL